jgi:hypothetical protein
MRSTLGAVAANLTLQFWNCSLENQKNAANIPERRPAGGALDEPQRGSIRRSGDSVTGFDDACLVAKLVGEPVAKAFGFS